MAINTISASLPAATPAKPAAPAYVPRMAGSGELSDVTPVASPARTDQAQAADLAAMSSLGTPSRQQIDQAMEKMRDSLPPVARNLQFSLDEETGRSVVKVVDSTTNEVVRQFPSEELLAIAKALDKFTGLMLKQKA